MKKILALLAVVLGVVSCQTEPEGLDVNVGGEQEVAVCVSLPEATRAADSAEGAFKNLVGSDEYTIRYIFQVFYKGDESGAARQVIYSDGNTVSFPVRLVPGRDYNFVAWADVVPQAGKNLDVLGVYNKESDYRYNTENLKAVTFNEGKWYAMDETFDAYTDAQTIKYYGTTSINLNLTRPFAKLRVMTTDMVELRNLKIVPEGVTVEYTVPVYKSFNVTTKTANTDGASTHTFTYNLSEVEKYTATETTSTLFTNYLFGAENGIVKFTMEVKDNTTEKERIKYNNFNTEIPVKRNYLTTIAGNILTDGNNIKVDIVKDGAFEGKTEWPEKNNNAEQLAYAAMFGGEVTLTNDVTLTEPLTIVNGANVVINLENKTLTGAIKLAEGAELTVNNGTIKNTDGTVSGITSNGDLTLNNVTIESARHGVRVESGKVVINGGEYKVAPISNSTLHALNIGDDGTTANVVIKGGTFIGPKSTMADSGSAVNVRNGSSVVIEGGNFSGGKTNTLAGQNITVKGGTFDQNPAKYVATGYKVIEKDGKYVVVSNEVDNVVASKEDVQNALKAAATAGETEVVIDANGANINLYYGLNTTTVPAGTTVTIRNANVEGSCYGNGANGTVIFEGCTFNNSGAYSIHFDNGNGNVIFKNCALYGWNSFGSSLTSVSFENCTLDGNGTYALIRSYVDLTLTNCVINTSNADHNDGYSEGVEAIAPATLTENNVTYVAENPEALKDAISSGATTIMLSEGTYVIPDEAGGKTITFVGTGAPDDTLITAQNDGAAEGNCDYSLRGSKATFENVTITTTGTYLPGYAGCQGTYKNCIINGVFTLYDSSSFENCTFNISGDLYNVWTWGAAEATFTKCTFNCDGKAMLLYGGANTKLTVNNCTFNDNGGLVDELKAAIEIGNDYNMSYELIVNNTIVNGFAINNKGINTGTNLWANKNSMPQDKLNVIVDGVDVY